MCGSNPKLWPLHLPHLAFRPRQLRYFRDSNAAPKAESFGSLGPDGLTWPLWMSSWVPLLWTQCALCRSSFSLFSFSVLRRHSVRFRRCSMLDVSAWSGKNTTLGRSNLLISTVLCCFFSWLSRIRTVGSSECEWSLADRALNAISVASEKLRNQNSNAP